MSHSQIITPAKRLFTQLFADDFDMSDADDTEPRADDADCPECLGTGEGKFDGQSCGGCRGRGY